ncbi:MAG: FAD-dependent oxidoreductase [Chloroflexi bacterium]|nr:FAD-dependent oxidoreductase [Chloroflexota bacterium]
MSDFKYLIVGGGLAAARACEGIREVDSDGSIGLVAAEPHLPYHRPPLSKAYLRGTRRRSRLYVHPEAYYGERNIMAYLGVEAQRITRRSRRVLLSTGESLGYEELLLATGGRAWRLPLTGADLEGVVTLRTIDDSDAIRASVEDARNVVVIGGSFIGVEVAASLAQMGASVSLCFLEEYPLQAVIPPDLGQHVRSRLEQHGVRVISGVRPERIEGETRAESVRLEDGRIVDADLVVMGVGIRLNTQIARDAELDLSDMSGVVVDEHLRTSDPHIYAAGDIAAWPDPHTGQRTRVEHWDVAYHQGHCAGRNMAGAAEPYHRLPVFFSDIFDLSLQAWGSLARPESIVRRGSLAANAIVFWYVREGHICGALAMGQPEGELASIEQIVARGLPVEGAAATLMDAQADLAGLLE